MACVYVLKSVTNCKQYIGSSREETPETRLASHNKGKTRSTKSGRPWILIYTEACDDYTQARKRESFLKSGVGRAFLKQKLTPERRSG